MQQITFFRINEAEALPNLNADRSYWKVAVWPKIITGEAFGHETDCFALEKKVRAVNRLQYSSKSPPTEGQHDSLYFYPLTLQNTLIALQITKGLAY